MPDISPLTNGKDLQELKRMASQVGHEAADYATIVSDKVVSTVKKYPLHSALAAAGVGFVLGIFITRK